MLDDELGQMLHNLTDDQLGQLRSVALKGETYRLPESYLSKAQKRRLAAVQGAREALAGTPGEVSHRSLTMLSSGRQVAPFDLVYVAAYIENGYVAGVLEDPPPGFVLGEPLTPPEQGTVPGAPSIELSEPCPFDKHHLLSSHWPGGAWYGVDPETHQKFIRFEE